MTWLFFKKSFYDGWDNFFSLAVANLVSDAILLGSYFLFAAIAFIPARIIVVAAGCALFGLHTLACATQAKCIADGGTASFRGYLSGIKPNLVHGLLYGLLGFAVFLLYWVAMPFYLNMGGFPGAIALGLVFWFGLVAILSLQWFPAIQACIPGSFPKIIRKCVIVFFDNAVFSIILAFVNLVALGASFFLAFLMPGFFGVTLGTVEAFRLRLMKYDWLEANPTGDRKKIPWVQILKEEEELTGTRSLKSLIFPRKD